MKVKLLFILVFFIGISAFAQEKTVSGTVTDGAEVLLGVSVTIKGTTTGTETDFDGKYSIKTKVGDVLVFSYLGFKTQEKIVGQESVIDVSLIEDNNVLDEIVVVGFGSQSKRKLTDNVVKLSSKDIEGVPTPNVLNSLASKATGVQIRQTNGKVEGGLSFRIRGQ